MYFEGATPRIGGPCDTRGCSGSMAPAGIGAYNIPPLEPPVSLPSDSAVRKTLPVATGVLDYFPNALAEIAKLSKIGNDKHNPGQPLHWSRGKSSDHADCIVRHLLDRGLPDEGSGGLSHSVAVAWRALALLEEELIAKGARPGRAAK